MKQTLIPQALTIAGSDCGGGAGIQADLKTFQELEVFGMSVITAITAQNTLGVTDIHTIPNSTISAQLKAIAEDFQVTAFKIGMLGNEDIINCVAQELNQHNFGKCVLDPVMVAKSGAALLEQSAIHALKTLLIPLADVITPNIPETEHLTGTKITDTASIQQAAKKLQELGAKTVVIKGGHGSDSTSTDWVFTPEETFKLTAKRFESQHTHGTGCTFSACIAAELAKGNLIKEAVITAKNFITAAITQPLGIGHGHGPVNHWAYRKTL